jgi:hypothetical protein
LSSLGWAAYSDHFHSISYLNRAAFDYPDEDPLPGHNAVPGLAPDSASSVTLLPDLGYLSERGTDPQESPYGQAGKVQPLGSDVFREISWADCQAPRPHLFDAFEGKEAYLAVPVTRVGVAFEAVAGHQPTFPYVFFSFALVLAQAHSYDPAPCSFVISHLLAPPGLKQKSSFSVRTFSKDFDF